METDYCFSCQTAFMMYINAEDRCLHDNIFFFRDKFEVTPQSVAYLAGKSYMYNLFVISGFKRKNLMPRQCGTK